MNNEENRNREELVAQKNRLKAIMSQYQSQLDTKIEDLSSRVEEELDIPVARYTEKQPEKAIGKPQKIETPSSLKLDEFTKKMQETEAKLKEEQQAKRLEAERQAKVAIQKVEAERQAKLAAEKLEAQHQAQLKAEKREVERQAKETPEKYVADFVVEHKNKKHTQEKSLDKTPQMIQEVQKKEKAREALQKGEKTLPKETPGVPKIPLENVHIDIPWLIPKTPRKLAAEKARAKKGQCQIPNQSRKAKKTIHEYAKDSSELSAIHPISEKDEDVKKGVESVKPQEPVEKTPSIFDAIEPANTIKATPEKVEASKARAFVSAETHKQSEFDTTKVLDTASQKAETLESTQKAMPPIVAASLLKNENDESKPIVEGTLQDLVADQPEHIQSSSSDLGEVVKGTDRAEAIFTQVLQKVKQTPEAQEVPEEIKELEGSEVSEDYLKKASTVTNTDTKTFLEDSEEVRDSVCDLFDINGEEKVPPEQNERFVPAIPDVKTYDTEDDEPDFIETLNEFGEEEMLKGHGDELGEFKTPLEIVESTGPQLSQKGFNREIKEGQETLNLSDSNPMVNLITPKSEQETVKKNPFFEENPALKKRFEEDPNLEIESNYETIPLVEPMRAVRQMLKNNKQNPQNPIEWKRTSAKEGVAQEIKPIDHIEDTHRLKRYEKDQVLHFFDALEAEKKDEKTKEKKPKEEIGAFPYPYEEEASEDNQDQRNGGLILPILLLSAALIATGIFCIFIARDFTSVDTLILITLGIGLILTMDNSMTTAMYMSIGIMAFSILGYGYLIFVRQISIGVLHVLWMLLIPACMLAAANVVEAHKGTTLHQRISENKNRK